MHWKVLVSCATGVIYEIPLSCGKVYIGQTAHCLKYLKKHSCPLSTAPCGHLFVRCHCSPTFKLTRVQGKGEEREERQNVEARYIKNEGQGCISEPYIALSGKELKRVFADTWVSG